MHTGKGGRCFRKIELLNDKLRHVKFFNYLSELNLFELGSIKPDVVRRALQTGHEVRLYREDAEEKQGDDLIGYSLPSCLL